ncbi:rRNA-processing protein UTP23 [Wickerhamiella sorbophila]|uniref:U three protein 23 n=1 Tax=Wickerhamiella sorbophila TaxID=45607 RepID=A0A2T0FQ01_9ASCO|nr:rRNA-processing protein UTP23 [Wickerhamiella sorbophila]PRT57068.1 rRNA-processing protein UTP23 [Wickerhamiella sorbophila]
MKLKRAKCYKKLMGYMKLNFKFHEPYQVLVDEELIIEACRTKYDLVAGLERTLQGQAKPMITQCTIEHLYRSKNQEAIELAKKFERRRCGHIPTEDQTLSAFECIASVVDINGSNKHRYVVATQKPKLRDRLRKIPAVPLIYINRSVMILEPMSPITLKAREQIEAAKLHRGLNAVSTVPATSEPRKRKVKEPNPLSVKKRKVEEGSGPTKRKRRHKPASSQKESENNPEPGDAPDSMDNSA